MGLLYAILRWRIMGLGFGMGGYHERRSASEGVSADVWSLGYVLSIVLHGFVMCWELGG